MSCRKIENFLNSSLGIFTLMVLLVFIVGASGSNSSTDKNMSSNKKLLSQSQETVKEQRKEISELKAKLEDEMKQEEKNRENQVKQEEEKSENEEAAQSEAEEKVKLEAKNITLTSGNYESGRDFEPGTYDVIAVKGGGSVYSSNSYKGGINAVLGSDEKIAQAAKVGIVDMYKRDYKNVELPKGTKLKVDGLEVRLEAKK